MSALRTLGLVLMVVGGLLLAAPVFWSVYTGRGAEAVQTAALAEWEHALTVGQTVAEERTTQGDRRAAAGTLRPTEGIVLTIPRLGLRRFVPEGARPEHLRRFGLGRISWTARPGQAGVVGIAGHRTTHGAPFFRLPALRPGDEVLLEDGRRRYLYRVGEQRTVRPTAVEVLRGEAGRRRLALVTCTPAYSAAYRLVVLADLQRVQVAAP